MLRVVGLALLLVVGGAASAVAHDGGLGTASAGAALRGGAAPAPTSRVPAEAMPARVTEAINVHLAMRGGSLAAEPDDVVDRPVGLEIAAPTRHERAGSLVLPWVSGGKPGLRLPVTERLAFAIGYRHVQGEDLWRRYAEAGSVEYDSHDFLVRAYWRF